MLPAPISGRLGRAAGLGTPVFSCNESGSTATTPTKSCGMRAVRWFSLGLLLSVGVFASEVAPKYVDLGVWARTYNFTSRPNYAARALLLTNEWTRIEFKLDSASMEMDGYDVRLSFPIRRQGSQWQISTRDLDTTLNPLVKPPKRPPGKSIRVIALGAGHGGNDPGNLAGPKKEKTYTLALARTVRPLLEKAGFKVIMIREDDTRVDLEERAERANLGRADLFVSLHFNGYPGGYPGGVSGVETYCLTPSGCSSSNDTERQGGQWHRGNKQDRENITLAYLIHRSVVDQMDIPDRGVRRARFKELTLLDMPGVLVEGGYLTNDRDVALIDSTNGRNRYARAIVDGIIAYKRLMERGQAEDGK
jgi:N-acetylmuramoyl-L-alanine amidase